MTDWKDKILKIKGYDYSKLGNISNNIIIICLKCSYEFKTTSRYFLKGIGCQNCARQKRYEKCLKFIDKYKNVSNDFKEVIKKFNMERPSTGNPNPQYVIDEIVNQFKLNRPVTQIANLLGITREYVGKKLEELNFRAYSKSSPLNFRKENETVDKAIFIEKCKNVHGNNFDYSEVDYSVGNRQYILVTCNICYHKYNVQVFRHLKGSKCPKCTVNASKLTTEQILKRCKELHKNKYNYEEYNYVDKKDKISGYCKEHDQKFITTVASHMAGGYGCEKCSYESFCCLMKSTPEEILKQCKFVHDNMYNYEKTDFTKESSIAICPKHGEFKIKIKLHSRGKCGCLKCRKSGTSNKEKFWLELENVDSKYWNPTLKINSKNYKPDAFNPITNTIYEFNGDLFHGNPLKFKRDDINPVSKKTFGELYDKTIEKEKMYIENGFNLISIWESEFDQKYPEYKNRKYNTDIIRQKQDQKISTDHN